MSLPLFVLLVPCLGLFAMLMPLFQPSCLCCLRSPTLRLLPWMQHGLPVRDGPAVALLDGRVFVDGCRAGSTAGIVERDRPAVIPELVALLERKAQLYESFHEQPGSGRCALEIPADTPAVVVKSLVASAAQAGFGEVDFMGRVWSP